MTLFLVIYSLLIYQATNAMSSKKVGNLLYKTWMSLQVTRWTLANAPAATFFVKSLLSDRDYWRSDESKKRSVTG